MAERTLGAYRGIMPEARGCWRNAKHAMIDLPEGLDEVGRGLNRLHRARIQPRHATKTRAKNPKHNYSTSAMVAPRRGEPPRVCARAGLWQPPMLQQAAQARLQVCGADTGCTACRAADGAGHSVRDQASPAGSSSKVAWPRLAPMIG